MNKSNYDLRRDFREEGIGEFVDMRIGKACEVGFYQRKRTSIRVEDK
jgi:hypothetical protein